MPLPVSAVIVYGLALLSIAGLMWWQSANLKLTLIVLLGTLACILILAALSAIMITLSRYLLVYLKGPWRTGLMQIIRYRRSNQLQMLALGLALMILLTVLLLRTDLLNRWQAQLPANAPNHFVINIQANEVEPIAAFFRGHNITSEGLYPMVRARISAINDIPVLEAVPEGAQLDEALKRELNISWASVIQENNKLLDGQWFTDSDHGKNLVSIEQGLAKRLGISLGDTLTFQSADKLFKARIKSFRKVQWDSFQPNFYIVFPPQTISHYPHSYISSFYLPSEQKDVINNLIRQFPGLTVIEVDAIMQQVNVILDQVTLAVEYVMLFVLIAGLVVLVASLQSSMDERIHTAIIMRTLGAKRSFLRQGQLAEFTLLGLFSGILAISGTEIIAYGLYSHVFKLDFELHTEFWILGPVAGILLILLTGWMYTRRVIMQPPARVLNN
jgi:putative ABC transport system permease protein